MPDSGNSPHSPERDPVFWRNCCAYVTFDSQREYYPAGGGWEESTMSEYLFGLYCGHLIAAADQVAERRGAQHVNCTEPSGQRCPTPPRLHTPRYFYTG